MSVAHILKYYREEIAEISQKDAAYRLNIRPSTLSNYENGVRQIPIDILRKMKDIYYIDHETFMAIILYETTDPSVIKESQAELSEKRMRAEDEETIHFLRNHPALLDEIRTMSHLPPSKQKTQVKAITQLLKVLKNNFYT